MRIQLIILLAAAALLARPAAALDAGLVEKLGLGDSDEKVAAINALAATGDPKAAELLAALADGDVQTAASESSSSRHAGHRCSNQ
jgi:urea transport system permease protein